MANRARALLWVISLCGAAGVAALVVYHHQTKELERQPVGARTSAAPSTPEDDAAAAPTLHMRASTRDVTFLAVSDAHLGYVPENVQAHLVRELEAIAASRGRRVSAARSASRALS